MEAIANIILESTSVIPATSLQIIEEQEITSAPDGQPVNKVIFKSKLQTAEEDNQNGRFYKLPILQEVVRLLKPKAINRSLFQEVDHPLIAAPDTNSMIMKKRAITVQLKNCGSLIRNIYMDGNDVIGEIETLSGFRGPDIYHLIVDDKATIGFSVRMFGRIVKNPGSSRQYVDLPIRPITYDIVTNPSHKGATILEFLPEDASNLTSVKEESVITEDCSCLSCDNVHIINEGTDTFDYLTTILEDVYKSGRLVVL